MGPGRIHIADLSLGDYFYCRIIKPSQGDTMTKLKVGIIGVGGIARTHIPGWQASPEAELVAGSDLGEEVLLCTITLKRLKIVLKLK